MSRLIVISKLTIICTVMYVIVHMSNMRGLQKMEHNQKFVSGKLFEDKPNADLYWQALVQVASGHKEHAQKIATLIASNESINSEFSWKTYRPESINDFFDKLFLTFVFHDPQMLSGLGLFESIGIRVHNAYLNDVTPERRLRDFKEREECLDILQSYDIDALSDNQKVSYKIFEWMLKHHVAGRKFLYHEYRVSQMFGILSDLTLLLTQFHQLESREDVDNYIFRLKAISTQLDQTIALLSYQQKKGIIPPAFALEKVVTIIQRSMPSSIAEDILYEHLATHVEKVDLDNPDAVLDTAKKILQGDVYPAYKRLEEYCKQLLAQTPANNGVWALPDGDDYYDYILAYHTSSDLSADAIHQLGLKEVGKIQDQIREILAQQGIIDSQKSVGQLIRELEKNPDYYFPQNEHGRMQCIQAFENILDRCRKKLHPLFDLKPQAPVKILPVPKHEEEGAPGAYYASPSIDGSRAGAFFVNLRNMNEMPKYRMETLAIHEAEPGHHFQIALQNEMNIPILRKVGDYIYTAFVEGWALYVEKLAYEQNFYSTPFDEMGHLQDELLRAVRLVVDTGIHKKRWTRERAIEYMMHELGWNRDSIVTEVERYFVLPGQACAYKIGQLKILELRDRAKKALGENFDIRQFHNVILQLGASPLSVLAEIVDQYIANTLID